MTLSTEAFLERFFGPGNEIAWEAIQSRTLGQAQLDYFDQWLPALSGPTPGPVILPRLANGRTTYYAVAFSDQQGRLLREDLLAFIGVTYTDFVGVDRPLDDADPVEHAVAGLIEPLQGRAYRFTVADQSPGAKTAVRKALVQLRSLWDTRPDRTRPVPKPTGRLLRDYYQALNAADDDAAKAAIRELRSSGRLSAINFVYLEVQRLAVTRQWNALLDLEVLPTLLQVGRPPRVTDAIAQAVMRTYAPTAPSDPEAAVATFMATVLPRFGVLFNSARELRSLDGARYVLLASLASDGPPVVDVLEVTDGPFGEDPLVQDLVARLGTRGTAFKPVDDSSATLDDIALELEHRRPERALDLLRGQAPSTRAAELALRCASKLNSLDATTYALESVEALVDHDRAELMADRYAQLLYDDLYSTLGDTPESSIAVSTVPADWVGWLRQLDELGPQSVSIAVARDGAEQWHSDPQFTEPGHISELTDLLLVERSTDAAELFWNALPHLLAALDRAGSPTTALRGVYDALFSVMALRIVEERTSADLSVLERLLDWRLQLGLDEARYSTCLLDLRECWEAVRSPKAVAWALNMLELLLDYPVPDQGALDAFADAVFDQIRRSAGRIDEVVGQTAILVAIDFGRSDELRTVVVSTQTGESAPDTEQVTLPPGTLIALYSLTESALKRAQLALGNLYPDARVETSNDHVCSDRLKSLSKSAQIFVVATRSAKHAATDCVESNRAADHDITYAAGKGTSSLVSAAQRAVQAWAGRSG